MVSEKSTLTVIRSNFTGGFARFGGIACFLENYVVQSSFINCIFAQNSAVNTLFDTTISPINISGCVMVNNTNILIGTTTSNIFLNFVSIINHFCSANNVGCILNANEGSNITLNGVFLFNLSSLIGEGTIYAENAYINVINSNFSMVKNKNFIGSCASIYSSILQVINSSFESYDLNCFYSRKRSQIFINSSTFSQSRYNFENVIKEYGTIFCEDCIDFKIFNSSFSFNANVSKGAAIYLTTTKQLSNFNSKTSFIINCTFLENSAKVQGGAIYVFNQNISFTNNTFQKNSAIDGGGIYLGNSGF